MPLTDLFGVLRRMAEVFEERGIPYAVSGAVAQNFWGVVRTTLDLDLLMTVPSIRVPAFVDRLKECGGRLDLAEALRSLREEHVLRFTLEDVPVEIFVPYLPFHASVLGRAVRLTIGERAYPVVTAEDLIVLKALFHREKDWSDIAGILLRRGKDLDRGYVDSWLQSLVPNGDDRLRRWEEAVREASGA